MNLIEKWFGSRKSISSIDFSGLLNPNYIEDIRIRAYKSYFEGKFIFSSSVIFKKNGEAFTKEFKGDSLNDVYQKVYDFCSKL